MSWEHNRPTIHIPAVVKRFVRYRAGDYCELRYPGCQGNVRLEYHHIVGVTESGGPGYVDNGPDNVALACHWCHSQETQGQANPMSTITMTPERHPGLKW
jgi:hypothetical protein